MTLALVAVSVACSARRGTAETPSASEAPSGARVAPAAMPLPAANVAARSLGAPQPPASGTSHLLTRLGPEATGIVHRNYLPRELQGRYLHAGAGVAAGDIDGDGLADLFLVSEAGSSKLYRNLGGWRFEDITAKAGVTIDPKAETGRFERRHPMGAYLFDMDGDRDLDLFITAFAGSNLAFENDGHGGFHEVTEEAGLAYVGGSATAAFADYDRDGDVDIYVATYRPYGLSSRFPPMMGIATEPQLQYDMEGSRLIPEADRLYRNNGDGTFEEVGEQAGIVGRDWGLSAEFADIDLDGWPDLYVSNDYETPDRFYANQRDGTFSLLPPSAYRHSPFFSMGLDFEDINNDGFPDLMTTDMLSPDRARRQTEPIDEMEAAKVATPTAAASQFSRNAMYVNNGDGTFVEVARYAGVEATDWTWTAKFADLDLDGLADLLITNGFVEDGMNADARQTRERLVKANQNVELFRFMLTAPSLTSSNRAFRNRGDFAFEDVSAAWGFDDTAIGNGLALADLDADGDLDVVVNNMNAPVGIYRNDATANRLRVGLRGTASNAFGLGARVEVLTASGSQTRELGISGGYLSSHEPTLVFGLAEASRVDRLTVSWPSGVKTTLSGLEANQVLTLTEPDVPAAVALPPPSPEPQFRDVAGDLGIDAVHVESEFDDFEAQPLLPIRLSRLGPGLAWGDANGDGWDDLYIGGSAAKPGALYLSDAGERFRATAAAPAVAAGLEEQAVLWWDPGDGSGRRLLTSQSAVEAGSSAHSPLRALTVSRDGRLAPEAWSPGPGASAGPLAAADVDGDADLDVFVGGRVQPGRYPFPADSVVYQNDAGVLVPRDDPALRGLGLVTSALWTDADADGDPDLLVGTEWGPVRLLRNAAGRLTDATQAAGLGGSSGFWSGLAACDPDHDGDMDVVAANLGLNTRFQATADEPLTALAGDLDGDGNVDFVETERDGGTRFPARTRRELAKDLPGTWDRFPSYEAFAHASVDEVLGPGAAARATTFEVARLAHTLFRNDGSGAYEAVELPTEAQLLAGFGVACADLDGDGNDDIYLVGNSMATETQHTGALDGGVSAWLRGDGKGGFASVPVRESGLSVPQDAKGLALSDYDRDGWLDVAVGVNSGPVRLFHNRGAAARQGLVIRLKGQAANPRAIGARLTLVRSDGLSITREVQAGDSYLSQSGADQVFGLGDALGPAQLTVQWPDGSVSTVQAMPGAMVEVSQAP